MKVYIASDHAGYELKKRLLEYVVTLGYEVEDMGPFEYNEEDDYPDYIQPLAERVAQKLGSFGIAIGGSGQGESICANKVPDIRSAVYYGGSLDIPRLAREHNDAQILSIGARFVIEDEAEHAVKIFLTTPFSGDERHIRRIEKIEG